MLTIPMLAQNHEIRGLIIDKKTEKPVSEAHVTTASGEVVVTNDSGFFNLIISKIPAIIRITHVSYGIIEYQVNTVPDGLLVIRIEENITGIDEVQISDKRMRILTEKDPYSVQDFAIGDHVIWFLGFLNKHANQQNLFLANLYGDTLATLPVNRAKRLYQDVFNNVHIVFEDSVYQLFHHSGDQIEFLYPTEKNRFFGLLGDIELAFNQKLIYSLKPPGLYGVILYYIQKDDPVHYQLTLLTDTLESNRRKTTRKIDRLMSIYGIPELANMWSTVLRYSNRGSKFEKVINNEIPYTLFQTNNNLFIINYPKDSLLRYSPEGRFEEAIPITFHKETFLAGIDYKELTCLTDPITQKVYVLERYLAKWVLSPLDLTTGKTEAPVQLPDFPGMVGICVYNEAVYFIYQEKLHPYYTRLYRYQL